MEDLHLHLLHLAALVGLAGRFEMSGMLVGMGGLDDLLDWWRTRRWGVSF